MPKQNKQTQSIGRRRQASARVRLLAGSGDTMVNGRGFSDYFPGSLAKSLWMKPFQLTGTLDKFHATIKVTGGGVKGQLDAAVHGASKTLSELSEDNRAVLKRAGLLTRDARKRERRKVGMGGKARRKKQSPKR